jgi:hypothetical protein
VDTGQAAAATTATAMMVVVVVRQRKPQESYDTLHSEMYMSAQYFSRFAARG